VTTEKHDSHVPVGIACTDTVSDVPPTVVLRIRGPVPDEVAV